MLISLFDHSGNWSAPFEEVTTVVRVDLLDGWDVLSLSPASFSHVTGVLLAPPCTCFTNASSLHWKRFDDMGATAQAVRLVTHSLDLIREWKPAFWCLENPPGRLEKLVPELKGLQLTWFHPWHFGDPYTKRTNLWGNFIPHLIRKPVKPIPPERRHSLSIDQFHDISCGGKSSPHVKEKRRSLRSETPKGFANAFYQAHRHYF